MMPFIDLDNDFLTMEDLLFMAGASGENTEEAEAEGNPATFETDIAKPLVLLEVPFWPIQEGSGEPAPNNVRNISGISSINVNLSGVNMWNEQWEVGSINGSTGQNTPDSGSFRSTGYIPVIPYMQYYLYYELPGGATPSSNIRLFYYDRNKTFMSATWANKQAYTVPAGVYYLRFYGDSRFGAQNDHVSFNYPYTDTEYHAYDGNHVEVTLTDNGVIYGGSVDLVSGTMDVKYKMWTANTATMNRDSDNYPGWNQCGIKDVIGTGFDGTLYAGISDDHYMNCGTAMGANTDGNADNVFLSYSRYGKTEAEWKALALDVQFVYHLEIPETVQLPANVIQTLIGENVILTDTGGSNTVVYLKKK